MEDFIESLLDSKAGWMLVGLAVIFIVSFIISLFKKDKPEAEEGEECE